MQKWKSVTSVCCILDTGEFFFLLLRGNDREDSWSGHCVGSSDKWCMHGDKVMDGDG